MYDGLKGRLHRELQIDAPTSREAVSVAIDALAAHGHDLLTVRPSEVAGALADDIEDHMASLDDALSKHLSGEAMRAWRGSILLAFGKAQRLCADAN